MNAQKAHELKQSAGIFLGLGLALIVLGSLAIYSVVIATFASVIFFGWILIFAGFIQFGHALYARRWDGFLMQLLLGIFSLAGGVLILINPAAGAIALTLMLSFLFIVQGALRITLALMKRFAHWQWVLVSGIFSLILGILILYQWPYSGLYVIGLFVGIDLIFNGWALVMLGMMARRPERVQKV